MAVRVVLNHGNVGKLLRSQEVANDLQKRGERIAAAAGPGFAAETFTGRTRVRVTVRATTNDAKVAQEQNDVLTKAIPAGR